MTLIHRKKQAKIPTKQQTQQLTSLKKEYQRRKIKNKGNCLVPVFLNFLDILLLLNKKSPKNTKRSIRRENNQARDQDPNLTEKIENIEDNENKGFLESLNFFK